MTTADQNILTKLANGLASPSPESQALIEELIEAYNLASADETPEAILHRALDALKAGGDLGVTWEPASITLGPLMGFFAYSNDDALPGVTSLTIHHTTNREGYDFENNTDDHPLQSLRFPNYTGASDGGYLNIKGFSNLALLEFPSLIDGSNLILNTLPLTSLSFSRMSVIHAYFNIENNPNLISIDLPVLVESTSNIVGFNNNAALTSFSAPLYASAHYLAFNQLTSLESLTLPAMRFSDDTISISECPNIAAVNLPLLETVVNFTVQGCNFLTGLVLPNLTSSNFVYIDENPLLTTISWPQWLPGVHAALSFTECALSAASVNHILARCIANPDFTGTVDLSGGTSHAPTGQGITDAAALILRGCTVTTN